MEDFLAFLERHQSQFDDWWLFAITTIGFLIATATVFRQRQLRSTKPKFSYNIGFPYSNRDLKKISPLISRKDRRAHVKNRLFHCTLLPANYGSLFKTSFHVGYLPVILENRGRTPIRNIQVLLEYPSQNLIGNSEILEIGNTKQFWSQDRNDPNSISEVSIQNKDTDNENLRTRQHDKIGGRATVRHNIDLLRPGENYGIMEPIRLTEKNSKPLQDMRFTKFGYDNIVSIFSKKPDVLDSFPVFAYFRSEDHDEIKIELVVITALEVPSGVDELGSINKINQIHWFDNPPKKGIYTSLWGPWQITNLFGLIVRTGRDMHKKMGGNIIRSQPLYGRLEDKTTFSIESPDIPQVLPFVATVPNCDLLRLPNDVTSEAKLLEWVGFVPVPVYLGGPKPDSE